MWVSVLVTKLVFTQRPHNAACKKTKELRTFTKIQYYSSDIKGFDWYFSELSPFMWNKDNILTAGLPAQMQVLLHTTTFLRSILYSKIKKDTSFHFKQISLKAKYTELREKENAQRRVYS